MRAVKPAVIGCVAAAIALALFLACPTSASAQTEGVAKPKVALVGLDALGMDEERVLRLETLFLKELERLTGNVVPNRQSIAALSRRLRRCNGGNKCLGKIGKALNVDYVVSGSVAALGDAYVLNIKAVTSGSGEELRRIESDPLRGAPDELIESIRVAAYRLLSPDELVGSISILADREGAVVELDGKQMGTTPLAAPLSGLTLGNHKLRVSAGDFGEFEADVRVRFQKSTRVAVQLVDLRVKPPTNSTTAGPMIVTRDAPKVWYQKTWFLVSAGVGAVVVGVLIGSQFTQDAPISCTEDPMSCMP
jgi:TolB-like protein